MMTDDDNNNARNNSDNNQTVMTEMTSRHCHHHHHQETTKRMTTTTATAATAAAAAGDGLIIAGKQEEFVGVEAFLVGISPMYWAHVPMSILDIHNLQLINGIHCMILQNENNNNCNSSGASATATSNSNSNNNSSIVAVSKCSLMGMVVLVEQRPGSILFVLDDGTALMDCLLWLDKDIFELPSCLPGTTTGTEGTMDQCTRVGQMVRVLGRIECVSVQDIVVTVDANITLGKQHSCETETRRQRRQRQHCIREIHVTLLEPIPVASQAQPHSLNAESLHWLEYSRRFWGTTTTIDSSNKSKRKGNCNNSSSVAKRRRMKMMNASHILHHFLGPDIAQQVSRRESLPSAHDKMASWKLFGVACRCSSSNETTLKYKDELLYCHCQATALVSNNNNNNKTDHAAALFAVVNDDDAGFVYRDALLNRLLELQTQQQQQQSENDDDNNNKTQQQQQPLQFQYKTVATDSQLMAVLDSSMERIKASTSTTTPSSSTTTASSLTLQQQQQYHHRRSRVIQKTFAALRKDGILALLSVEADVYLLISRSFVLEPYIRMMTTQQQNSNSTMTNNTSTTNSRCCPDYLSNVPKARLEFVRRTMSLLQHEKK